MSLKLVAKGPSENNAAFVQLMALAPTRDK